MGTSNGIKYGYRSGLESKVSKQLEDLGVDFGYETFKIEYEVHEFRKYTPDFLLSNGIIVETKGRFIAADRKKHLLIQKQHPDLDIRFVFSNSKAKLNKGAKSTYAQWCEKQKRWSSVAMRASIKDLGTSLNRTGMPLRSPNSPNKVPSLAKIRRGTSNEYWANAFTLPHMVMA